MARGSLLLCALLTVVQADINQFYTFDECRRSGDAEVHTISGAVVLSQRADTYTVSLLLCSMLFQTPLSNMQFLVQVDYIDLRQHDSQCLDYLSISSKDSATGPLIKKHIDRHCGGGGGGGRAGGGNAPSNKFYSHAPYLHIEWERSGTFPHGLSDGRRGFLLTLTALTQLPALCHPASEIRCENNDCISRTLLCDYVEHCYAGEDERNCPEPRPPPPAHLTAFFRFVNTAAATTTSPHHSSTHSSTLATAPNVPIEEQMFLWLPLVVVAMFTAAMVGLVFMGRRTDNRQHYHIQTDQSGEQNNLRIDVNGATNIDLEPGVPITPPPSYSVIERQTSYVSQISQNSDQVSIPPDYDEAVELPGRRSSRHGRRVSRSSSSRLGSLRARMQNRLFSRSVSVQEQRGRYRSQRGSSSTGDAGPGEAAPGGSGISRSTSVTDDVFESPPAPSANGEPGSPNDASTPYVSLAADTSSSSSPPPAAATATTPSASLNALLHDDPQGLTILSDIMELNSATEDPAVAPSTPTPPPPQPQPQSRCQSEEMEEEEEDAANGSSHALLLNQMTVRVDVEREPGDSSVERL